MKRACCAERSSYGCQDVAETSLTRPRPGPSYDQHDQVVRPPSGYASFCCPLRPTSLCAAAPGCHGSPDHGPADLGPADHGPPDHGPPNHGQADHGPPDRCPADQGRADLCPADGRWSDYLSAAGAAAPVTVSSSFCSPVQSARGAKRRAASSSTLSSDVLPDIVAMIRHSPTAITPLDPPTCCVPTRLGSGSISHLSARTSLPRHHHHHQQWQQWQVDELDDPLSAVIAMYNLEDQADTDADLDCNQVVVRHSDNFVEQPWTADQLGGEFSCDELATPEHELAEIEQQLASFMHRSQLTDYADLQHSSQPTAVTDLQHNSQSTAVTDLQHSSQPTAVTDHVLNAVAGDDGSPSVAAADVPLVCLWLNCGQLFFTQDQLVQHIELHVDQRSPDVATSSRACVSDEYVCQWADCSRLCRPFNARYKLLIHMRVHSGEKPHKCTVSDKFHCTDPTRPDPTRLEKNTRTCRRPARTQRTLSETRVGPVWWNLDLTPHHHCLLFSPHDA